MIAETKLLIRYNNKIIKRTQDVIKTNVSKVTKNLTKLNKIMIYIIAILDLHKMAPCDSLRSEMLVH